VNDWRYMLVQEHLQESKNSYELILMVDLDVGFGKDPFSYMRHHSEKDIWSGSEWDKSKWGPWVSQGISRCYRNKKTNAGKMLKNSKYPLLNAGIFAGKNEKFRSLLNQIVSELENLQMRKELNCNFVVYNKILFDFWKKEPTKIGHGSPFHSKFFKNEHKRLTNLADGDKYIYHK